MGDMKIGRERGVIGTLIVDQKDEIKSFIIGYLDVEDFSDSVLRGIYASIIKLTNNKTPSDISTLMDEGHDVKILANLASEGMVANCRHYATIIKTESLIRKAVIHVQQISVDIQKLSFQSPNEVIEYMNNQLITSVPDLKKTPERIQDVLIETIDQLDKEKTSTIKPMTYGMRDLDYNTGGLRRGEMTIVAAGPGTGKTAFAMNVAVNIAKNKKHVLLLSREMNRIQVARRIISNSCSIDGEEVRDGKSMTIESWERLVGQSNAIGKLDIIINDNIRTIEQIINKATRLSEKGQLDVMIIDYLQLLESNSKHESRRHEIEYISRQLKMLTLDLDIHIISLSQMNREGRKNSRPKLTDLRESGALEQDADNVIFLHDPDADNNKRLQRINIEILIEKQRNGRTGMTTMVFDKQYQRFVGMER